MQFLRCRLDQIYVIALVIIFLRKICQRDLIQHIVDRAIQLREHAIYHGIQLRIRRVIAKGFGISCIQISLRRPKDHSNRVTFRVFCQTVSPLVLRSNPARKRVEMTCSKYFSDKPCRFAIVLTATDDPSP